MLKIKAVFLGLGASLILSACSNSTSFIPSSGPSSSKLMSNETLNNSVHVIDINSENYLFYSQATPSSMTQAFVQRAKPQLRLGAGDIVQISIWEAPPAVLFGTTSADSLGISGGVLNMPEQMITDQGYITVPFVGNVKASGRTLDQIQQTIRQGLSKIANKPQVMARLSQNNTNTVTLIADRKSVSIPLTAKGERLIDVIPSVTDIRLLKSTSFVIERAQQHFSIRADDLTRNSMENIYLYPGDTVRVMQDQYEVTVLGATNSNTILNYGDNGLSISDVIAKTSGLNDFRANPKGVFVFRKAEFSQSKLPTGEAAPEVLRFDLTSAEGLLLAQKFQLKNKDMLYVSNASGSELQKFLSIIGSILSPVSTTTSMTK